MRILSILGWIPMIDLNLIFFEKNKLSTFSCYFSYQILTTPIAAQKLTKTKTKMGDESLDSPLYCQSPTMYNRTGRYSNLLDTMSIISVGASVSAVIALYHLKGRFGKHIVCALLNRGIATRGECYINETEIPAMIELFSKSIFSFGVSLGITFQLADKLPKIKLLKQANGSWDHIFHGFESEASMFFGVVIGVCTFKFLFGK